MIPTPWIGLVLALAAFRVTRLLGWDDFPPVAKLRFRITRARFERRTTMTADLGGTADQPEFAITYGRPLLMHFLGCAYCLGFWVSLAGYLLWVWFPTQLLYAAFPFALSGAVGITGRMLDP